MNPQPDEQSSFGRVAIVGVGMIGGSIAAAVKKRTPGAFVLGVGRSAERLEPARSAGLLDEVETDVARAAARADLIVFCTPVDRIVDGVRTAAVSCRPTTLITDAGSVKREICDALADSLPAGVDFIGSHPLAGSEKQGWEHADADLCEGRVCVVTPTGDAPPDQLARLHAFWRSIGFRTVETSPAAHDAAVARTSHAPHALASALAAGLADGDVDFTATGYRDATRIAAGDPDLWTAILLSNRSEVVAALDEFSARLDEFRNAIEEPDAERLKNLLEHAKRNRDRLG